MHKYSKLWVHLVFATLDRRPLLDAALSRELYRYIGAVARNIGCEPMEIGGHVDHVHCLIRRPPTIAEAEMVSKLKANSSRWLRQKDSDLKRLFSWQRGYGAFSVSESNTEAVARYIRNQAEHHRKVSFQEELRRIFERHGLSEDGFG